MTFRVQTRLRTLIVVIGVAGALFAFYANESRKRQVEAASVMVIEALGGQVIDERSYFRHTAGDSQRMKGWLRPTPIVDAIMIHRNDSYSPASGTVKTWDLGEFSGALNGLPDLQCLCLTGSACGDGDLEALPALGKLRCLSLAEARVTDMGVAYLPKFENLFELSLAWTAVENDLSPLRRLTSLACLDLTGTSVGNEGVWSLVSQACGIQRLWLGSTRVSDDAVESICVLN